MASMTRFLDSWQSSSLSGYDSPLDQRAPKTLKGFPMRQQNKSKEHLAHRIACLLSFVVLCAPVNSLAAEKSTAPQLIVLANSNSPALEDAILATFAPPDISKGIAWTGHGPDFFFAVQAASKPAM